MIIMSVDLGKARTGIAASDESESFAFPKTVIKEYNAKRLSNNFMTIFAARKRLRDWKSGK